jgi:hypothetical protein
MRNPNRIRPFLDELAKAWEKYPDMRFGQLLVNMGFGGSPGGGRDPWFAEEAEWLDAFHNWEKRLESTNGEQIRQATKDRTE